MSDYQHIWNLTPREEEAFRLMVLGLSQRDIAKRMGVKYTTTRYQCAAVTEKLGIKRHHAPVVALAKGIVTLEECLAALPKKTRDVCGIE